MGVALSDLVNVGSPRSGDLIPVLRGSETHSATLPPLREFLDAVLLHVSPTGSDVTGNGSEELPWATIQHAVNYANTRINANQSYVHVLLAPGTYTESTLVQGTPDGSGSYLRIIGDETNPSSRLISTTGTCFAATTGGANLSVRGVKMASSSGHALQAAYGGNISWQNVDFGACPNGFHVVSVGRSYANATGPYTISAGARAHFTAYLGASINIAAIAVTLLNTPAFSSEFARAYSCSDIAAWSATFAGSATGTRYYAYNNGTINVAGAAATLFPGSVAGTVASGGTYA